MMLQEPRKPHRRLEATELCGLCDRADLHFKTTAELEPLDGIIGQERALRAIRFGLGMRSFGYNLFVAGTPGTGKKTLIRLLVEEIAKTEETPDDVFYVYNFERPERPQAIVVPPGVAAAFRDDMEHLVKSLKEEVPKAFKSEDYESRKNKILQSFQSEQSALNDRLQHEARERNLTVKPAGAQILTLPIVNGHELTREEYENLSDEEKERIQARQREFSDTIQEVYRQVRDLQQQTQHRLKELDRTVALISSGYYLDDIRTHYSDYPRIVEYLEAVQHDVVANIANFLPGEAEEVEDGLPMRDGPDPLKRYRVNVIVDNSKQEGAPVIEETHPTFRNLIGYTEREVRMGTLYTDFTMIRAGSILQANKGFLILDLIDLLTTPLAWDSLKRVLQDGSVNIQEPAEQFGLAGTIGLRPEPVPVDLKVIVLGSAELYGLLYSADESFQKLFKVRAEFDTVMKKDDGQLERYARFVRTLCDKEQLRHFEADAVAVLIEHSSRMVSDKTRLTLRFSDVADLIREAHYWATLANREFVAAEDVRKAIGEKIYRSNLFEEKIQEMIDEGSIMIQTTGEAVGQINGLSVYQTGDYAFGKPTRITAEVSVGDEGIVNIEREAHMSGRVHDKGVLILSGFLHGQYGQKHPLSLHASICFEQSYSGVDGDSASSTELYAILSALSGIPVRQSIAVTGSINQKGVIQPIGGVNEKIEGFYAACESAGLTGDQGVVIPHQNVQNLMLNDEVIEAVRNGRFHIYPVASVDDGMEILTGVAAGEKQADGTYPEGTIHQKVQTRLAEMAEIVRAQKPGS
ncbi:MAG: ATP-binding protein [Acidobacteriota bacterium]